jgi:hypothetical protein
MSDPNPSMTTAKLTREEAMRKQKEKMQRQFEAVPYLIVTYIFQLISMFLYNLLYNNAGDNLFTYEEKIVSYFLSGLFYILYFNGIIKFVKSFYNIMNTSKIDDSDLVAVDAWIAFALGCFFVLYGTIYTAFGVKAKMWTGYSAMAVGLLLWAQAYLMRKFYIVAAENMRDDLIK